MRPPRAGILSAAAVLCLCTLSAATRLDRALADPRANPAAAELTATPQPRAYLFRGFAGVIFSRGTDQLAERIEQAGFATTVNEAVMCDSVASEAIGDYRRTPF